MSCKFEDKAKSICPRNYIQNIRTGNALRYSGDIEDQTQRPYLSHILQLWDGRLILIVLWKSAVFKHNLF